MGLGMVTGVMIVGLDVDIARYVNDIDVKFYDSEWSIGASCIEVMKTVEEIGEGAKGSLGEDSSPKYEGWEISAMNLEILRRKKVVRLRKEGGREREDIRFKVLALISCVLIKQPVPM